MARPWGFPRNVRHGHDYRPRNRRGSMVFMSRWIPLLLRGSSFRSAWHCLKILRYSSQVSVVAGFHWWKIFVADCSLTLSSSLFLWEGPQETETSTVEIRGQQNLSSTGIEESAPCCDGYESWPNVDTGITCGPALFISWVCYVKWG